ncbi:hypothetical protein [Luteimonas lutimaris]|uniref:Uncharacterized protein n=1 Tax=Luteimonas lutimaris TaxID=698645 RepID=A0ABP7M4B5_9GAMM
MTARRNITHAFAAALTATLAIAGCTPAAGDATQAANADAAPAAAPQPVTAAPTQPPTTNVESAGTIAVDGALTPETLDSGNAWAGQPPANTGMAEIRERLRRLHEDTQAEMARIDANSPGDAAPAPDAPAAPAGLPPLPPANVTITGTTLVVKDPVLARDAVSQVRNAFVLASGCRTIDGIHATPGKATGPFNTNAQGRLVSGSFTELWKVSGCGASRLVDLLLRPTPDGGVDIATSVRRD